MLGWGEQVSDKTRALRNNEAQINWNHHTQKCEACASIHCFSFAEKNDQISLFGSRAAFYFFTLSIFRTKCTRAACTVCDGSIFVFCFISSTGTGALTHTILVLVHTHSFHILRSDFRFYSVECKSKLKHKKQKKRKKKGKRSEERRVGKECWCPCRSRWSPYH